MTLRVGLLGCGRIAALFHAPILGAMKGIEVTAIADGAAESRDRVGAHLQAATRFSDWNTALAVADLDAVVICLPPALHAPAAIASLQAGLHVYVEKPLALDLDEAEAMVAAWRASGRVGMAGLNFRFHPLIEDARRRREAGELGQLVAVRTLFTSARRTLPGWKGDPRLGGGALADLATHHVDLAAHLAGQRIEPASIRARERRSAEGSSAVLTGAFADGAHLEIMVAQTSGQGGNSLQLLGERGHLTIDLADARPRPLETPPGRLARVRRIGGKLGHLAPAEILHAPGREPSFARALDAFVAAARTGAPVSPDFEDGRRALALITAAERAAAEVPSGGEVSHGA